GHRRRSEEDERPAALAAGALSDPRRLRPSGGSGCGRPPETGIPARRGRTGLCGDGPPPRLAADHPIEGDPMRVLLPLVLVSALVPPTATGAAADKPLLGFSPEASARQRELEKQFDERLKADDLRAWMKQMTARPHELGSKNGKDVVEFAAAQFRAWGYDTRIEEF